jgi:hypothetical protein
MVWKKMNQASAKFKIKSIAFMSSINVYNSNFVTVM